MRRPSIRRLVALLVGMMLAIVAIVVRLSILQVSRADSYQTEALDWRLHTVTLPAARGQILDRSGESLAISLPARDVYADPRYVTDPRGEAKKLSGILDEGVKHLREELTTEGTFVYLARSVPLRLAERIQRLHLPGIGFLESTRRVYPAGPLASQVLGFVGVDGIGLSGLEVQYEEALAGQPGERTQETDPAGRPIVGGVDVEREPVPGVDLVTTIQRDIQFQTQAALEEAVKRNGASGGTAIVMDARTGDIYAMASYPWFDPNDFSSFNPRRWRNTAVTDAFEPGSVCKVVTAAAAVEEHVVSVEERFEVPDHLQVGTFTIHDSHSHPIEDMTLGDIVAQSSNIGAVFVAEQLEEARLATYLSKFGLGHPTGVGFPGESSGVLLPLYRWTDTSLATMAYGQGVSATALQMASVYATIANGGEWVRPRLVRGTVGADGTFDPASASPTRRVVSERTAKIIARMLAYAVEAGTGTAAQIPGYQVAGKTGTARIPKPGGGYYTDRHISSFIGFLPASDPEIVILATLDRPVTIYGSIAAAPLFRAVARYAIERLGIAPAARLSSPPHVVPVG
ncbi:MAG: penicillin-binding protein 2 [Actinomycetota bacterium]